MTILDVKRNFIVDTATELFLGRSIAEVTIRDIAAKAGVGEATVYRYFTKKLNIVQASAEKLQREVFEGYFVPRREGDGYHRLKSFFDAYLAIFRDHTEFYRFVSEFDAYLLSEGVSSSEDYSSGVDLFRDVFLAAYEAGVRDGSVRRMEGEAEQFYYAAAHAMLGLCKKLATERGIVRQDLGTDKLSELNELKKMILFYLVNPRV